MKSKEHFPAGDKIIGLLSLCFWVWVGSIFIPMFMEPGFFKQGDCMDVNTFEVGRCK